MNFRKSDLAKDKRFKSKYAKLKTALKNTENLTPDCKQALND